MYDGQAVQSEAVAKTHLHQGHRNTAGDCKTFPKCEMPAHVFCWRWSLQQLMHMHGPCQPLLLLLSSAINSNQHSTSCYRALLLHDPTATHWPQASWAAAHRASASSSKQLCSACYGQFITLSPSAGSYIHSARPGVPLGSNGADQPFEDSHGHPWQ